MGLFDRIEKGINNLRSERKLETLDDRYKAVSEISITFAGFAKSIKSRPFSEGELTKICAGISDKSDLLNKLFNARRVCEGMGYNLDNTGNGVQEYYDLFCEMRDSLQQQKTNLSNERIRTLNVKGSAEENPIK